MFLLFLKGIVVGFAIAAPVGPIGLLCIQRSLRCGFKIGLLTGLGAATADSFYGLIAALGLTALSAWMMAYQSWIHCFGGLFLVAFGFRLMLKHKRHGHVKKSEEHSLLHAYGTTVLLTMMNPLTLFSFIAICAGFGIGSHHQDYLHAFALVLGIFLGSSLWWLFLSSIVAHVLHHRIKEKTVHLIDKISGVMLFLFGIVVLLY
ncbi:MAG: LysE family translocator [Chthoniobacterales bacterium]|nr:LysE family translocator [Chthoniobacterales bacterium]